ncbi:MAG TPA: HicB family protein [Candidatus Latescibacteria bacterium]|nr:HicB family protein [Gemmatimonadota bacterium]HCR16897.1 HicB family protein [Candidatus Latescibacterota bacterium]
MSGFTFTCPEVSTVSQGKTLEQDVKTLREATELYLEEFPQADLDRSLMTTFEVAGA